MARKYMKEFTVTMVVKSTDEEMTERLAKSQLQGLANGVHEFSISIGTVTQTYPAAAVPVNTPDPTAPPVSNTVGAPVAVDDAPTEGVNN